MKSSCVEIVCLLFLATGGGGLCKNPHSAAVGILWVDGSESVSIPCGHILESNHAVSLIQFTNMSDAGHVLANNITNEEELTINISQSDVNSYVCCLGHGNDTKLETQELCHQIKESYAPKRTELSGYQEPVFGQPFQMECPLVGTPDTLYYWQKYEAIDMATETNFSTDVQFSDSGHVWYVDVVTAEHSGMYVCRAKNGWGEEVYVDTTNFFISVSGCPYHAPDISIQIAPTDKQSYKEGESVQLVCTAVAVEAHEQPFWWRKHDDGPMTLCARPEYMLNNTFERSACRWTTVLTIPDFSTESAGPYHCGIGYSFINTTLNMDDGSRESSQLSIGVLVAMAVIIVSGVSIQMSAGTAKLQYTEEPKYDGFTYDAFISAHDETKEFVLENILHPLETNQSPYSLCWHSRDFMPGIPIMEQIAECIVESRKIIFVFSERFMQSEFCRIELELAMNKCLSSRTRCIVPVALTERDVPALVKQRITYLPILPAASGEGDMAAMIAQVIGKPIAEVLGM